MRLVSLPGKIAVRFKNKACDFLNGYTSNTLDCPKNSFLNLKGQIVCTFDQMVLNPDRVMIAMEAPFFERLAKHLEKYLVLGDTQMERADEFHFYYDLDGDYEPERGEIYIPQDHGVLIGTARHWPSVVSDEEWTLYRLKNFIPVQGIDFDEELLLNVTDKAYVSYTKGCYLGQEIIARVHYRGQPPKKLVVKAQSGLNPEERQRMTSSCLDPSSGEVIGFVFVDNKEHEKTT